MKKQTQNRKAFVNLDNKTWEYYSQEKFKNGMAIEEAPVNMEENTYEEEEPTYEEFMQIVTKQKNKKAPEPHELKNGGQQQLLQKIYRLIQVIWRDETMPREWEE